MDSAETDTPSTRSTPNGPGLRQRKLRRTRDQLIREALELFLAQGYEHTTVEQIAEAVEVHPRTFFRHFASKEEVALTPISAIDEAFLAALEVRPAGENPLQAMSGAFRAVLGRVRDGELEGVDGALHMAMMRLVERTPGLLAEYLRRSEEMEGRLARIIAAREGVDLDDDFRPRFIVAVFKAVGRVVSREWYLRADTDLEALSVAFESALDSLRPELFADWRRPGA
ncbi:TetR/AcrR family transcriptional regulator [Streptomyces glaucescens]|uniref:HTH-type transcriptional regulator TcmR n=2 Tax=Streptomyces glaucescens TaxID=1907 RepID=TCMR_STRGA|nr:TetR/AcrR family transcriptional regulator [Streptomyces glaucescens]P39885.1 RecName: Full=HTH-type transcriptional regulator TcmR; AltName: Full=Tetracenomycin C transcriptional repressor [Streptomyces glaucescens]AIS01202.1 HTH-type transcriptional regulator TcmR [Streptomyces glaucescens]